MFPPPQPKNPNESNHKNPLDPFSLQRTQRKAKRVHSRHMARKEYSPIASQGLSLASFKNLGGGRHSRGGGVVASPSFFCQENFLLSYKTIPKFFWYTISYDNTSEMYCHTKQYRFRMTK